MCDAEATETDTYDVVIVGGGAAGLSAALALSRARRSVLVVDAGDPRNLGAVQDVTTPPLPQSGDVGQFVHQPGSSPATDVRLSRTRREASPRPLSCPPPAPAQRWLDQL